MIRRAAAPLCALLAATALASGCAPTNVYQGYQAIEAKPADTQVGVDTKSTVTAKLGTPSAVSTFDPNVWFYISQVTQTQSFYLPRAVRRDIVVLTFDKGTETVAKVDRLSLKDGRVIAYNGRETPTRGRELTFIEQLLGSLGNSSLLNNQDITPGQRPGGP
ncbi:MAG: outer membrane protein assembly factor BamE [Caulobacteraceae bacterium]|nr:outer membrane protein assembly factor BamE [Caulobacteraceae bacterium]